MAQKDIFGANSADLHRASILLYNLIFSPGTHDIPLGCLKHLTLVFVRDDLPRTTFNSHAHSTREERKQRCARVCEKSRAHHPLACRVEKHRSRL